MRRQVVEIQCDRCERVERQPVEEGAPKILGIDPASGEDWTALVVCLMVDGKPQVQFTMKTLCTPCTKTVKNHLEAIKKPIKGASPNRKAQPAATTSSSVVDLGAKKKAQGRP